MSKSVRLFATAFFACALILGCARESQTVKLYESASRPTEKYARLLVVNISSDSDFRAEIENQIVDRLGQEEVPGIASHDKINGSNGVPLEEIYRVSAAVQADGVLITRVASIQTEVNQEPGREQVIRTCRGGNLVDAFLYDEEVLREPDTVSVAHSVVMVTSLYDAATRERMWTIQSSCFDKASISEAALDEADAIVRQLLSDDMI